MSLTPFIAMQNAVDIVNTSEHNSNKIAACLFKGHQWVVETNHRPDIFQSHFTPDIKFGQSSQFIHSETACIFNTPFITEGAEICITDPPCPNCAKAICEAGITHVYIDHKGLDKDFAQRRGDDFESLSLLVFEKAGVNVSIIYRKEARLENLIGPPVATRKGSAQGIEFFDWDNDVSLHDYLSKFRQRQPHTSWALAKIQEEEKYLGIILFEELTNGLTPRDYAEHRQRSEKYRLPVDPLNRILYFAKRKGMTIIDGAVAVNLYPSSRALVNSIGFGLKKIHIGEMKPDHDEQGHVAAKMIERTGVLQLIYL
jgi:dCMP deaminase